MTGEALLQGGPDRAYLCKLACLPRASYYRHLEAKAPRRLDMMLRDAIQRVALANRFYGHRRVAIELGKQGIVASRKKVLALMRDDNLLVLRSKPFVPRTTNSDHAFPIAPNLIRDLVPTGLDQIWVADITYVRLAEDFVFLAVILDAFSRLVVGWALADHLRAELAIAALDMALEWRRPKPDSLIHHSDRGVQYASSAYAGRLAEHAIAASMSAPGNPYHNAKAESFIKTLKHEEVNASNYASIEEARANIGHFLETTYNRQRLHSALGYKPPVEFEAQFRQTA
jgi:putative transposase